MNKTNFVTGVVVFYAVNSALIWKWGFVKSNLTDINLSVCTYYKKTGFMLKRVNPGYMKLYSSIYVLDCSILINLWNQFTRSCLRNNSIIMNFLPRRKRGRKFNFLETLKTLANFQGFLFEPHRPLLQAFLQQGPIHSMSERWSAFQRSGRLRIRYPQGIYPLPTHQPQHFPFVRGL